MDELQSVAQWAADCAERSIYVFSQVQHQDNRPQNALSSIREFIITGKRTNTLRKLAFEAYRASLETGHMAASAAARAASFAAASAFTHPIKDIYQSRHILGAAAYSALAIELADGGQIATGNNEIEWTVRNVNSDVVKLIRKMPKQISGRQRINQLFFMLDFRLRELNEEK